MQRVIVYVDGFNFYYGLRSVKWRKYYWLDLSAFFKKFLKSYQQLVHINYFSAIPTNADKQERQDLFFLANALNPHFSLHLGKFLRKKIRCKACSVEHTTYEEKESDVRLATRMIADVIQDRCDITILVSADSDLIPPLEFIRQVKPRHKIFVYFPPNRFSLSLVNKSNRYIRLERHEPKFSTSLLPGELVQPTTGYVIRRPDKWV